MTTRWPSCLALSKLVHDVMIRVKYHGRSVQMTITDNNISIIIIIYLHSMQKLTVKYAMCRTERLTVLALTTARIGTEL